MSRRRIGSSGDRLWYRFGQLPGSTDRCIDNPTVKVRILGKSWRSGVRWQHQIGSTVIYLQDVMLVICKLLAARPILEKHKHSV